MDRKLESENGGRWEVEKFAGVFDYSVKVSVIEYTEIQRVGGTGGVRYGSSGHCSS